MIRATTLALALALPVSMAAAAPNASRPTALTQTRVESIGMNVLASRFLASQPAGTDLEVSRVRVDELNMGHVRVQQTYMGIPVFEGEAIVHLNRDGSLFAVTDNLVRGVKVDTRPVVTPEEAIALAIGEDFRPGEYTAPPKADLLIFARDNESHLAWRVHLRMEDGTDNTALPIYFIDAHSGETLWHYDNLQTATGSGVSLYSGTVSMETTKYSSKYYMEDATRKLGTFDMRNTTSAAYRFTDSNNVWDSSSQKAGVDAHLGARMTYEYYYYTFGRNGIDGKGGPGYYSLVSSSSTKLISSRVHYGRYYNNAYWGGSYMTYGDGDGTTFSPLVSIDVAGHEMTHGVTQYEANLTYSGESGALNESMSDVFGALIEFYTYGDAGNWQIGEDCYTPSKAGDALRYMDSTHLASNYGYTADDDPDHYTERYTGTSDNGGVHINSGIANFTFYLLANGGTHHVNGQSMTGIGKSAAGAIWYKALAEYMTSSTNFCGARGATMQAASVLYGTGTTEYNAVDQAWTLTGLSSSTCGN